MAITQDDHRDPMLDDLAELLNHPTGNHIQGECPVWAASLIAAAADRTPPPHPTWDTSTAVPVDFANLERETQLWFGGAKTALTPNGQVDRSMTLFTLARLLARGGLDAPSIAQALAERDEALGYQKYSRRRGGGVKEYGRIAQVVLASREDDSRFFTHEDEEDFSEVSSKENSYEITSESPLVKGRRESGKEDRAFFLHLSTLYGHVFNIQMRDKQKRIINNARALFSAGAVSENVAHWYNTVEHCVISIKAQYHATINQIALVPMHCGSLACVPCLWHRVENFFQKRGKLLLEHLPTPVVYQVDGIVSTIQEGDDGVKDIAKAEAQIRKSILRMADYEGSNLRWKTANTFIDSITPVLKGNELSFSIVLLANVEPNALQMLQERWAKETDGAAQVKIVSWGDDLVGAVDTFISKGAMNFDADGYINYERLTKGLKWKRLFQGHGALATVTMTRSSKEEKSGKKPAGCQICGITHPTIEHVVPLAQAKGKFMRAPNGKPFIAAVDPNNPIYAELWADVDVMLARQARQAEVKAKLFVRNPLTKRLEPPAPAASAA